MTEEKKDQADLPIDASEPTTSSVEETPVPPEETPVLPEEPDNVEPDQIDKVDLQPAAPAAKVQEYTLWERLNPAARRKKQMQNMQEGYREILGLVRTVRDNLDQQVVSQQQLLSYMQALPEAVEGMRKLSVSSAEHTEMLKIMQGQLDSSLEHNRTVGGSVERFNNTLVNMDQTTKTLVSQSRESEHQLRKMLLRAQRGMAFMTFLLFLVLLTAMGGFGYVQYQDEVDAWLADRFAPRQEQADARVTEVSEEEAETDAPLEVDGSEPSAALLDAEPGDAEAVLEGTEGQVILPEEAPEAPVNQVIASATAVVQVVKREPFQEENASNRVDTVEPEAH